MTSATTIHGTCDPRFRAIQDAFAANFAHGREIGASVGITLYGETVVDLWGGHADAAHSRPWTQDTLVNVYSTTKGLGATCAHILVDRGKLDLNAPVAAARRSWARYPSRGVS